MGDYAMLLKLTDQGRQALDDLPKCMSDIEKAWTAIEGEAKAYLMTGEYDCLVVGSAPRHEDVMALALAISKAGDFATFTSALISPDVYGRSQWFPWPLGLYRHSDDIRK